ncbi:MAG: polymer-forming cytoskeletal protein [Candidatus Dadabacteria bacterium]|nr:polymer-forming cytoskeletal protein [Candidatus Dadabacteria bacterium]
MRKSNTTIILEGMQLMGQVEGAHDFFLYGKFEGEVNVTELVKVGKSGRFKGELKAKNIIIEGEVDGKITAKEKIEIHDSGHFKGDIISPSIRISDQAFFEGNVTMVREDNKSPEELNTPVTVIKEDISTSQEPEQTKSK